MKVKLLAQVLVLGGAFPLIQRAQAQKDNSENDECFVGNAWRIRYSHAGGPTHPGDVSQGYHAFCFRLVNLNSSTGNDDTPPRHSNLPR